MIRILVLFLIIIFQTSPLFSQILSPPQGLYLLTEDNTNNTELYQILPTDSGMYIISDIYGQQQISTNFNDGKAINPEINIINIPASNGNTSKTLNRVFSTTHELPLTISQVFDPNILLSGEWNIEELSIDLITGEVLQQFDGSLVFRGFAHIPSKKCTS